MSVNKLQSLINSTQLAERHPVLARPRSACIGSLFCSQVMILQRLYFSRRAVHGAVDELDKFSLYELFDLNRNRSLFQRTFSESFRSCDDLICVARYLAT